METEIRVNHQRASLEDVNNERRDEKSIPKRS